MGLVEEAHRRLTEDVDNAQRPVQDRLIELLVQSAHATELYHRDATFHASVHTLAGMLPFMVKGLADQCATEAARTQQHMLLAMRQSFQRPVTY